MASLILKNRKGEEFTIYFDESDRHLIEKYKWNVDSKAKGNIKYVTSNRRKFRLHRIIMGITDPKIMIDHKDRNGLNNTRENLRIATNSQNQMNKISTSSSGYMGVHVQKCKYNDKDGNVFIS